MAFAIRIGDGRIAVRAPGRYHEGICPGPRTVQNSGGMVASAADHRAALSLIRDVANEAHGIALRVVRQLSLGRLGDRIVKTRPVVIGRTRPGIFRIC